jgi:hypothetical protein
MECPGLANYVGGVAASTSLGMTKHAAFQKLAALPARSLIAGGANAFAVSWNANSLARPVKSENIREKEPSLAFRVPTFVIR